MPSSTCVSPDAYSFLFDRNENELDSSVGKQRFSNFPFLRKNGCRKINNLPSSDGIPEVPIDSVVKPCPAKPNKKNILNLKVSVYSTMNRPRVGKFFQSPPPRAETRSAEYWNSTVQLNEQFRAFWIEELNIWDRTIPGSNLWTIVMDHTDSSVGNVPSIKREHVRVSMLFRQRSVGQICRQWIVRARALRTEIQMIPITPEELDEFRSVSVAILRIIVMLDDIHFGKDSAFFQRNLCNYCSRYACHMSWSCPIYPTESLRKARMEELKCCEGCGQKLSICKKGVKHHGAEMKKGCITCTTDRTHVGWRCASATRSTQYLDTTNRYICCWIAAKNWTLADWDKLLRDICYAKDIPYPEGITTEVKAA